MQLVKIEHNRCQEWDGYSFILAPDSWDTHMIEVNVQQAKNEYLNTLKTLRENSKPPNDYTPYGRIPYTNHPGKTVREIEEDWAKKKIVYEEWAKKTQGKNRRFENFLIDIGFVSLWGDGDHVKTFSVDWGHNHGLGLTYGTDSPDPTKPVAAIDEDEWDDDDFHSDGVQGFPEGK